MKLRAFLPLALLAGTLYPAREATAQSSDLTPRFTTPPRCAFNAVLERMKVPYSVLAESYAEAAATSSTSTAKTTGVVYSIPVVVHVVYGPGQGSYNLADSVIKNQIAVLTGAFRHRHADTSKTRAIFKPLAGDAEIQFRLATVAPDGSPTTGITRTLSTRTYFGSGFFELDSMERIKSAATGGHDPWPVDRYLNIWVGNLTDADGNLGVLGYAPPPLSPLPPNNWPSGTEFGLAGLVSGVVLQTESVGSNNPLASALGGIYTKGRTAVHEVGHYLGLQHVFGSNGDDATADCGALADDGIDDTPVQSTLSFTGSGCPPATKNSCTEPGADRPDMWENYMDYSRDACQNLFTAGQRNIMRGVMAMQRRTLDVDDAAGSVATRATLAIYPNPARESAVVDVPGVPEEIQVSTTVGQTVLRLSGAAAAGRTIPLTNLPAGVYLVQVVADGVQYTARLAVAR